MDENLSANPETRINQRFLRFLGSSCVKFTTILSYDFIDIMFRKNTKRCYPWSQKLDQSLYWWQKEIGALTPSQAWLLKVLERENELLKRLMTDLSLANQQVKDQVWRYLEDGRLYKMESGLLSGVGDQ